MGQKNNVWNHYFRDKKRFADLFNGVYFQGEPVIQSEALTEISGVYGEAEEKLQGNRKRNQDLDDYATAAERVGRIKKTDRLVPVYTLCLYHGEDVWDGPRSLKDMIDFGDDRDVMSKYFADYPLHLYCLNEQEDFDIFRTEIKSVFKIMKFRKDKKRLVSELNKSEFRKVDLETLEVISVALDAPQIWNKREKYIQIEGEKEEVNMCPALQEWIEEERGIGVELGMAKAMA